MFREILRFELRQQLLDLTFWLILLAFAGIGFLEMSAPSVRVLGVHDGVLRNASLVLANALAILSVLGTVAIGTFASTAALRDYDARTDELVLSMPVSRGARIGGRFVVAWLLTLATMLAGTLGVALGNMVLGVDPAAIGPSDLGAYLWAFGVIVVPGSLFVTALLFLIATATRSLLLTFVGVIVVLVLLLVSHLLMTHVASQTLAALLDPFGDHTLQAISRYWTTDQINHQRIPLHGVLLFNRLLWGGLGLLLLGITLLAPWEHLGSVMRRRRRVYSAPAPLEETRASIALPKIVLRHGARAQRTQWLHWLAFDARRMLGATPFIIVLVFTLVFLSLSLITQPSVVGVRADPTTADVLRTIHESLDWLLAITVVFYAGELVWRDRELRVADVRDALPWASWTAVAAKCGVLIIAIALFLLCSALCGAAWQLVQGYTHIEPGLYLTGLALQAVPYVLLAMLCLAFQVVCGSRFLGYLLSVLWLLLSKFGAMTYGWNDHLLWYGTMPRTPHSAFNGFGPFLQSALWFDVYWLALGAGLLSIAGLFWLRGSTASWRYRVREARARSSKPVVRISLALSLLVFVASGVWIFYNTHVLNQVYDAERVAHRLAHYEKEYAHYRNVPQPRIADGTLDVAIHPAARKLYIRGHYTLVNRHAAPIDTLLVQFPDRFTVNSVSLPAHTIVSENPAPHVVVYRLRTPLAPGASMSFAFNLTYAVRGFGNEPTGTMLVGNGSFFDSVIGPDRVGHNVLPHVGYQPYLQLVNPRTRRTLGLPPAADAMASLDDQAARAHNAASNDADWVHFDVTLSTALDQTAITSGVLQRSWTQGDRRYFHYVTRAPMPSVLPFVSARYAVRRSSAQGVDIELYYEPRQAGGVDRMMSAARDALAWNIAHYGPYPFGQLRVAVVPYNEAMAAESFPGVLVVRETGPAGLMSTPPKPGMVDPLTLLIAHEVSHQWWGSQELPANVRGANLIAESLAQYSALMLLKHQHGMAGLQPLSRYLLDGYLQGRRRARQPESPLVSVGDGAEGYVYYSKGALAMYALADYVGEAAVDRTLRQFVAATRFQPAPYPTSTQFLELLDTNVAAKWHPLIDDLFRKITLFDNRMINAVAKRLPDGKYEVTMHVDAAKYYADGNGKQTRASLSLPIEIGVFGKAADGQADDENPLYLAKHPVSDGDSTITVVVDGKPYQAGIDPFGVLIDRIDEDNRLEVAMAPAGAATARGCSTGCQLPPWTTAK